MDGVKLIMFALNIPHLPYLHSALHSGELVRFPGVRCEQLAGSPKLSLSPPAPLHSTILHLPFTCSTTRQCHPSLHLSLVPATIAKLLTIFAGINEAFCLHGCHTVPTSISFKTISEFFFIPTVTRS
jgi:hypothetical protein